MPLNCPLNFNGNTRQFLGRSSAFLGKSHFCQISSQSSISNVSKIAIVSAKSVDVRQQGKQHEFEVRIHEILSVNKQNLKFGQILWISQISSCKSAIRRNSRTLDLARASDSSTRMFNHLAGRQTSDHSAKLHRVRTKVAQSSTAVDLAGTTWTYLSCTRIHAKSWRACDRHQRRIRPECRMKSLTRTWRSAKHCEKLWNRIRG